MTRVVYAVRRRIGRRKTKNPPEESKGELDKNENERG